MLPWNALYISKSVLFCMTCACTLILRWGDIETVAQGELDATGIVILHLAEHHAVAVEHDMVDATIENIAA